MGRIVLKILLTSWCCFWLGWSLEAQTGPQGIRLYQLENADTANTGDSRATYEGYFVMTKLDTFGIDDYRLYYEDTLLTIIYGSGDSVVTLGVQDTVYITYPEPSAGGSDTTYAWIVTVDGGSPDTITNLELINFVSGSGIDITHGATNITISSTVTDTDTYIDSVRQITGVLDSIWLYRNDLSDSLLIVLNDSVIPDTDTDTYIDSVRHVNDGVLDSIWFYRSDMSDSLLLVLNDSVGAGGGGSDTNFAHDDLTADDDRDHDWDGYDFYMHDGDLFRILNFTNISLQGTNSVSLLSNNDISATALDDILLRALGDIRIWTSDTIKLYSDSSLYYFKADTNIGLPPYNDTLSYAIVVDTATGQWYLRDLNTAETPDTYIDSFFLVENGLNDTLWIQRDSAGVTIDSMFVVLNDSVTVLPKSRFVFTDPITGELTTNGTWSDSILLYNGGTRYGQIDDKGNVSWGWLAAGSGNNNTRIGGRAGYRNQGDHNTYLGFQSGYLSSSDTHLRNTSIGYESSIEAAGDDNTYIGSQSGRYNISDYSVYIGAESGYMTVVPSGSSDNNLAMGYQSARDAEGDNNVYLGNQAGLSTDGSNNIFIGSISTLTGSVSNRLAIGGASDYFIDGDMSTDSLTVNSTLTVRDVPASSAPDSVYVLGPGHELNSYPISSISGIDTYIDSAAYNNVIDTLTLYRDSSGVTIDSFKVLIETDTFRLDYDSTTALLSYSGQLDSPLVVLPWKDAGADDYSANYFKDSIRHDGYVGIWTVPEAPLHVVDPAYPTPGADTFEVLVALFEQGGGGSSEIALENGSDVRWRVISHSASRFMISHKDEGVPKLQIDTGAQQLALWIKADDEGIQMQDYGQGILQDTFSYIAGWRSDGDLVEISLQDLSDSLNQLSPLSDHDFYQILTTSPTGSIDSMIYTNQSVVLNKDTALCEGCELVIHPRTFDSDVLPTMRMIQHDSTVWGEMSVWDTDGVPFMSFVNSKATSGYTAFSYRETDGNTPFSILGTAPEGSLQIRSDGQIRRIPYGSGTFGPSIHPVNYITAVDTNGFVVELDWSEVSDTLANYLGADSTVHRDFDFILLPLNDTLGTNIDSLNPDDSTDLYALIWHGGQVRIGETPYQIRYDTTQGGVDATAALQIMGQNDAIDIYHDSLPTIWIRNNKGDAQIRYSDNEMEHDTTPSFLEFGFISWQDTATMGTQGDTTLRHPFRVSSHANTGALEVYQDSILLGDYVEGDTTITTSDLLGSGIFMTSPNGKLRAITPDSLNAFLNVVASGPQAHDTFAIFNDTLFSSLQNDAVAAQFVDLTNYNNSNITISNDSLFVGDSVLVLPQGADSSGVVIPTGEIYVGTGTRGATSYNTLYASDVNTINLPGTMLTGEGVSTGAMRVELGGNRSGNGNTYIDFHGESGQDYDSRLIRYGGENGLFQLLQTGTAGMEWHTLGQGPIDFKTSSVSRLYIEPGVDGGDVGINTSTPSATLHVDGDVRLENLSAGTLTQLVMADANGKLKFASSSGTFDNYNSWQLQCFGCGGADNIASGEVVGFVAGTGIDLNYDGTDLTITNTSSSTDDQQVDEFAIVSNTLRLQIEDDGQAVHTVSLSPYLDNTDNQGLDVFSISTGSSGGTLSISLDGNGTTHQLDIEEAVEDIIGGMVSGTATLTYTDGGTGTGTLVAAGGSGDDMGTTVTSGYVIYGQGSAVPDFESVFTYSETNNELTIDDAIIDGGAAGFVTYGNTNVADAYLQVQDDGDIALFSGGTAQRIFFDGPEVYSSSGILFGIGRSPTTNNLEVGGTASKTAAGDWLANSDERLKQNINQLSGEDLLQDLLKIRGVEYEWKPGGQDYDERPEGPQYGLIAQDIQEAFPRDQFVNEDNNGYLQASYGTYDPVYIEVIRHLDDRIKKLESQIENLKQK